MKQANLLFVIIILVVLVGCSGHQKDISPEQASRKVIDLLLEGDLQIIHTEWFDSELQNSMTMDDLKDSWEGHIATAGEFVDIRALNQSERDKYNVFEAQLIFSNLVSEVRMVLNDQLYLVGLNFSEGIPTISLPESITEEEIIVGEGTKYELNGLLTLPKENKEKLPAVVLVHGSGPSDKDESVFSYKPFRDIAWGLAEQGIAVIRYDKRTYTYGKKIATDIEHFTVYEETIEDAILATERLKSDERIDKDKVYILGHSLGAILAPRIDLQGGDYNGIIMLAGSPRPLWEIVYDQNQDLLEQVKDNPIKEEQQQMVEVEYEKAKQLQSMSDEQAKEMTVFGMNGYYLKEMDQYDLGEIVVSSQKPLLIMQGEDDFQVYFEKDFTLWQDLLKDHEHATLIHYPGLNHFFIHYEGLGKGTIAEYRTPKQVEQEVIDDISKWILELK